MEGGIEGALVHLNDGSRDLLQPLSDSVAVRRFEGKDLENHHIERALRDGETSRRHRYLNLLPFRVAHDRSKVKVLDHLLCRLQLKLPPASETGENQLERQPMYAMIGT